MNEVREEQRDERRCPRLVLELEGQEGTTWSPSISDVIRQIRPVMHNRRCFYCVRLRHGITAGCAHRWGQSETFRCTSSTINRVDITGGLDTEKRSQRGTMKRVPASWVSTTTLLLIRNRGGSFTPLRKEVWEFRTAESNAANSWRWWWWWWRRRKRSEKRHGVRVPHAKSGGTLAGFFLFKGAKPFWSDVDGL